MQCIAVLGGQIEARVALEVQGVGHVFVERSALRERDGRRLIRAVEGLHMPSVSLPALWHEAKNCRLQGAHGWCAGIRGKPRAARRSPSDLAGSKSATTIEGWPSERPDGHTRR